MYMLLHAFISKIGTVPKNYDSEKNFYTKTPNNIRNNRMGQCQLCLIQTRNAFTFLCIHSFSENKK